MTGILDVLRARRRLSGRVRRTPLVHCHWLSDLAQADVWLKLESWQITGSFKVRGALNLVLNLAERHPPGQPPPRLVTASAGNHGQGLAWAAAQAGIRPVVFTSRTAPATKLDAIRRYGADLRAVADDYDHSEHLAKAFAASDDGVYISPYGHPDIIAATGTIALEVIEDLPEVEMIVAPVGGGGLVGGIAAAMAAVAPAVEVVGAEAEASPAFSTGLAAGHPVRIDVKPTLADGLAGNLDPESVTFDLVRRFVRRLAPVSELDLAAAIVRLVSADHLVTEGAGAAAVAAIAGRRLDVAGRKVAVVVSGANIDTDLLARLLTTAGAPEAPR